MKSFFIVLTVAGLAMLTVCALTTPLSATAGTSIGAPDIASGATVTKVGAWYRQIIDSLYAPLSAPFLYAQDEEEAEEEAAEEEKEPEPDTNLERTWNVVQYA
jgi:hypothetical protein